MKSSPRRLPSCGSSNAIVRSQDSYKMAPSHESVRLYLSLLPLWLIPRRQLLGPYRCCPPCSVLSPSPIISSLFSTRISIAAMSLELLSSACLRGFTTEPPTCIEFSPCGQRLAFCSPRGAICIANIAGTPSIRTMSPPGGHFASALSWENDEYLWVALSNGHVIQLHLPLSGSTFTISDWLTYRFPSDSCVQKILRLLQHALVAVAFADRVEVWRRTCKSCSHQTS